MKKDTKQIFCDLDGVLVDFETGAMEYMRADIEDPSQVPKECKASFRNMVSALKKKRGTEEIFLLDISRNSSQCMKEVRTYMYCRLEDNRDFWSNLDWMPDGKKLWSFLKTLTNDVKILTAPMKGVGCDEGKREWVKKNLGDDVDVYLEEDKYLHASSNRVLIDDTQYQIRNWESRGGIPIHHTKTTKTIKDMKNLLSLQ